MLPVVSGKEATFRKAFLVKRPCGKIAGNPWWVGDHPDEDPNREGEKLP